MLSIDQIKAFRLIEKTAKAEQRFSRDNYGLLMTAAELRINILSHEKAPLLDADLLEFVAQIVESEIGIRIELETA